MQPNFFIAVTIAGLSILGGGIYFSKKMGGGSETPTTDATPQQPQSCDPSTDRGPERLFLSNASDLWTEKVIQLSAASVIWAESPEEQKRELPRPVFTHEAIDQFYSEMIEQKKSIYGKKKAAIIALLILLDKDGECPSIVRNTKHPDPENKYSEDVFSMLSEIPLYEHTLSVATSMAQKVGRETLLPDALIAALGHDIGKIPDYHERGYSTGDHPVISSIVLNGLKEFTALSNHGDLDQIVRRHHDLNPSHPLAALLKECDLVTRNIEISAKMKASVMSAQAASAASEEPAQSQNAVHTVNQEIAPEQQPVNYPIPAPDPSEERDHPLGLKDSGKDAKFKPQRLDIPWFNPDEMLNTLKPFINIVHQGRWGAVSMPDGMVYVNAECLWGVIKKVAPEDILPMLLAADIDEATKRNMMYSVVWTLSEQRQAIAAEMIHPDYNMIPVSILSGTGKPVPSSNGGPQLMAPFRAEAFGVLPSDLENAKTPTLRRMVKSIKPKNQEGSGHV